MILLKGDLPPAIVKSSSQRESYLDALAHSDVGGDILPLAGLFLVTLKKYARELSKPQVATKLFREELARRGNSAYEWWLAEFERFLEILAAELSFHRLTFHRVGSLDIDSFRNLQKLESEGNAWIAIVRDRVGREVLLWWGYPSANMRPPSSEQERFPSVFLSVPAPSWSLHRFHRASAAQTGGLREFAIYPGAPTEVRTLNDETARANRLRRGTVDDSAAEIAERIASGFANNMIPLYSR